MAADGASAGLLRDRNGAEHGRVTFVELFFDLVFVFAITQLSHALAKDLTFLGALHTLLLLMAVWWAWIFTSWVINWLNPGKPPVRLLLVVLMLAGLVLSVSIPKAFDATGVVFAGAYVFIQLGRTLFTLWALGRDDPALTRNFQRILAWLAVSAVFWIAGALVEGEARLLLWLVALGIEYLSPSVGFWTPGLGRSSTSDWNVEGAHMAERCGLFIIIALGESILITGATFAGLEWSLATVAAFLIAFTGSVAMWWLYFDAGAEKGSERIVASSDPGRLARLAYTYIHLVLVAGIIVAAVADELLLGHADGHAAWAIAATILGGPALYLLGNALFKRAVTRRLPASHVGGMIMLALVGFAGPAMPLLALAAAATSVLILVAVWEFLSPREGSDA